MKFTPDSSAGNVIRSYVPGEIRLRDTRITENVVVSRNCIISGWSPPTIDELTLEDFRPALDLNPDIILFGTGDRQRFPELRLLTEIMQTGAAIEVMDTHTACMTYNVLIGENRAAVAALLVG